MYTYMEYLQRCFNRSTGWNEENIFSNITATSNGILNFAIPNNLRLDVSSQSSDFSASSFTLSNQYSVNGSVSYLYSSMALKNTLGTKDISLQEISSKGGDYQIDSKEKPDRGRHSLLYGRMYFPGSSLEAMIIKKLTSNVQLLIKCINNPDLASNGTMIMYLQKNTDKYSNELIYSTNESLIGFRCLYNFFDGSNQNSNSVVSMGTELWYAARTMSPGLSTAFKYASRAKDTPLTMTLAVNPILGHISSTYSVKTSKASKFCSRYDFNLYSYDSNLTLGFELFNRVEEKKDEIKTYGFSPIANPIQKNQQNYYQINPELLSDAINGGTLIGAATCAEERAEGTTKLRAREEVKQSSKSIVNKQNKPSDFTSVVKFSTSLTDKSFKILWEGKLKDFLVSTGVKVDLNHQTYAPDLTKFGISFSYAC